MPYNNSPQMNPYNQPQGMQPPMGGLQPPVIPSKPKKERITKFYVPDTPSKVVIPKGTVSIKLYKAKKLVALDHNGKSDPYVFIEYQAKTWKSKVLRATLFPEWDETCTFEFEFLHQKSVIPIKLFDHDRVGKHDFLGVTCVPLAGCIKGVEIKKKYKLEKVSSGKIEIGITCDFSLPPCDPITYAATVTELTEGNLKDVDPMTYKKHKKDSEQKQVIKGEGPDQGKSIGAKAAKGVAKFFGKIKKSVTGSK